MNNNESNKSGKKGGGFDLRYNTLSVLSMAAVVACAVIFASAFYRNAPAEPVKGALGWETMRLDGDRDGFYVEFSHQAHSAMPKEGCVYCHHLSMPDDSVTPCSRCHRDMKGPVSIFNHESHAAYYKNRGKYCEECHGAVRAREHVKKCETCHQDYNRDLDYYLSARSYESAMHDRCIPCHRQQDEKLGEKMYNDCGFCHVKFPAP